MSAMDERALRQSIVDHCIGMNGSGLNQGTSGNISARCGKNMLITPSGRPYVTMKADDLAVMPIDGEYGTWTGPFKPSSEWQFHLDIMKARSDVGAIVHTHSTFATILSMQRKPIPACHYMIAAFGGNDVRCSDYARYGTKELSDLALTALEGRTGCLLANHGMIAVGPTLEKAMWTAIELETIARQYYHALLIGGPVILSDAQIEETRKAFATYGLQTDEAKPKRS